MTLPPARKGPAAAPLPAPEHLGCVLDIVFVIEGATSPHAEGLSHDRRVLGLALCKLTIAEAEEAFAIEHEVEQESEKEEAPGLQKVRLFTRLVNRMRN
ncbi:hypothetical protein [Bradyrhizobium sp. McL0616]|uniref:hypothetical protein n=1 Tax=Bradyrhizobium sp. McL0616 TaxID=3415674 RepID=UPI003CFAF5AF